MLYPKESYQIMGACLEVHDQKGSGFLKVVFQECLEISFVYQNLAFVAQPKLTLTHRRWTLKQIFRTDFICLDKIVVETKAVDRLIGNHESQALNYLIATDLELGILIKFGAHPKRKYNRLALSRKLFWST